MKNKLILPLLLMAFGIPLASLQFYQSQQPDHRTLLTNLQSLKVLDIKIHELVIRARYDIDKNYDSLSERVNDIDSLCSEIKMTQVRLDEQGNTKLSQALAMYESAWKDSIDDIENFKMHNSILKNSQRYAPLTIDSLHDAISEAQSNPSTKAMKKVKTNLSNFIINSSEQSKKDLQEHLNTLNATGDLLPDEVQPLLQRLVTHVQKIIDEHDTTNYYLQATIGRKADDILKRAVSLAQEQVNSREFIASLTIFLSTSYLLILAAFLIWFAYRQWIFKPRQKSNLQKLSL